MSITQRGRKFKKGIVHSVFYEVSQKCEDEYWKQFFLELSIGKNIRNIFLSNGKISCTNKKNNFEYYYSDKSPDDIIRELIPILIDNYVSGTEKNVKIKTIIEQIKKENEDLRLGKWSKIRRKNLKISLLQEFMAEFQKKHNLYWDDCTYVYRIFASNINRSILTKLVQYEDGKIININGLDVDENNKIVFHNNFYNSEKDDTERNHTSIEDIEETGEAEDENEEESFQNQWELYIKRYFKNIRSMLS